MPNALVQGKHPTTGHPLDVEADPTHKGLVTTDPDHHLIHAGKMFYISGKHATLAAGATLDFHGLTDSAIVHFRAASIQSSDVPVEIYLYEGADITANGTPLTAYNRKRSSTITPTLQTFISPTIGGGGRGTAIDGGAILAAGPARQSGVADLFAAEWVLDLSNTSYLISVTNNNASAVDIYFSFLWYEV